MFLSSAAVLMIVPNKGDAMLSNTNCAAKIINLSYRTTSFVCIVRLLWTLRNHQGADQVGDDASGTTYESEEDPQQSHDRRIQIEILGKTTGHTADFLVVGTIKPLWSFLLFLFVSDLLFHLLFLFVHWFTHFY